ncbi:Ff.00g001560.m01.CDS01 [Fusarium sp. VM40]|nr:Ff.00g001560.m01.CDS01 [Fusarium sp. VM40]
MVTFAASIGLFLTAASSVVAVPNTIEARKVSCMDNLSADSLANVKEAVECINYLASLGNQPCVAKITGLARKGPSATSTCQDVARGAGFIMDKCSRGDGKVRGQNEAWANGNLLVDIRNNPL